MGKRIIVVDDDKDVREIVTFVLNCHGLEVTTAASGRQFQQLLYERRSHLPDLVILDVMMPGEDGYQIYRGLRSDPRTQHIPVMIITAHEEAIYRRISVDLGAAQHLTKPFHPLELAEKVKGVLSL